MNYHLWEPCNMACAFCFATFQDVRAEALPKGHLPAEDSLRIVELLAEAGFEKINFAGGEPTLCKWLGELIRAAKAAGMTTSVVTNGSFVNEGWVSTVEGSLDWLALSVDTVDREKAVRLGRATRGEPVSRDRYLGAASAVRAGGIRLKMNTVVTAVNWEEDLTEFVRALRPERWKIFQVLPVTGQNDDGVGDLLVTEEQFERYVTTNRAVEEDGVAVVVEDNDLMTGSYVMVDPAGRLFDNVSGRHTYSRPVLEVGVEAALGDVTVLPDRFTERRGLYDW